VATLAGLVAFYTLRLKEARNEAVAEAARSQRVMRFVLDLFRCGDQYAGPANDLRVVTLVDRGVDEARALSKDPSIQAELYRTLADVYRKLGNLDKADSLLQSSLAAGPGENAATVLDMALLRADQARFEEEAERLARQGLELVRRARPPGHPAIAQALEALGKVLEERGSYDTATKVLQEDVTLRQNSPATAPGDLAATLSGLAGVHFYAGRYAESERLNRRVLALHREIYGPAHPSVADDLINLGAIQQDTGHYPRAETFHRQAFEITRRFYGEDHPRTAANLTLIGRALIFQQRMEEAESLLHRALAIRERVYGPAHPQVASTLNELGTIALVRRQFAIAAKHYSRVVAIYRKAYSGKHYLIGLGLANLASAFMARKDYEQARSLLREALAMYVQTLPATHLNVGIARIKLGRTLLRSRRYAQAEGESRAGFEILSKQAQPSVSWLNSARQDLPWHCGNGRATAANSFANWAFRTWMNTSTRSAAGDFGAGHQRSVGRPDTESGLFRTVPCRDRVGGGSSGRQPAGMRQLRGGKRHPRGAYLPGGAVCRGPGVAALPAARWPPRPDSAGLPGWCPRAGAGDSLGFARRRILSKLFSGTHRCRSGQGPALRRLAQLMRFSASLYEI
jgi:serine/threonine-protein kinase